MSECPKCHQLIDSQAITCNYCGTALKAFGHPGIPLHRAQPDSFLCDSCTYHEDDSCNYPQRPYAKTCTLYQNSLESIQTESSTSNYRSASGIQGFKLWCARNKGLLFLFTLLIVSVLITTLR
ncbi:MAG: zinc ribbon domain-containing protein [Prochloraceae cyanobacterium]